MEIYTRKNLIKKFTLMLFTVLLSIIVIIPMSGCGTKNEILVVSPYDENDGNRVNFVDSYKAFENETGITINDQSKKASETGDDWKTKIQNSFNNNKTAPDVLFFFTGTDADELIEKEKVVSIRTIRKEYPNYASNMKEALMPLSTYDSQMYSVPVNGYWEGMYVNKKVLADCGINFPDNKYSWEQFLNDCQTIKEKGYTPIAFSFSEPHYLFEFSVFNNGNLSNHLKVPQTSNDIVSEKWSKAIGDIKELYDKDFFPSFIEAPSQGDACKLLAEDKAAFLIDGSWRVGFFQTIQKILNDPLNPEYATTKAELKFDEMELSNYSIDNFAVTYVPAYENKDRKPTEIIGGISMGYYITKKAWDDPKKKKMCVDFIQAMTTDEVVNNFGALSITALKNGTKAPQNADALVTSALVMTKGCTGIVSAVQDSINTESRNILFTEDIKKIVLGNMTVKEAIDKCFNFN